MLDGTSFSAIFPSRCRSSPRLRRICQLRLRGHLATRFDLGITSESIGGRNLFARPRRLCLRRSLTLLGAPSRKEPVRAEFSPADSRVNSTRNSPVQV